MKLIINADDFGKTNGINHGVIDAYNDGILTSTTIMANGFAFDHAARLVRENHGLGVGIHLVLTFDKPLTSGLKTLVDENGYFFSPEYVFDNYSSFDEKEVEKEFRAQIKKVIDAGIRITHIDSHHHVHSLGNLLKITCKIAKEMKLPIRRPFLTDEKLPEYAKDIKMTEILATDWYDDGATQENLFKILTENLDKKSLEIMCHPGYLDKYLYEKSGYAVPRMSELEILTSDEVRDFIDEKEIDLIDEKEIDFINFSEL